jgi:hypothetical protein
MTQEEFDTFVYECLGNALFHVMSEDVSSETGAKLEEEILVQMLAAHPGALKYHPLSWWVENYVGKCYLSDIIKENKKTYEKQFNAGKDSSRICPSGE